MNDQTCLICFEELPDSKLSCCNKLVHERCIKDWWSRSNFNTCPHCRQESKLIDNVIVVDNCYFVVEQNNISEINENDDNFIPNNLFRNYNINQNTNRCSNMYITFAVLILFMIFIVWLVIIISNI
jgi:hypothetical protein